MVALYFYDEYEKIHVLNLPEEYAGIDVVDISIEKFDLKKPLYYAAFAAMNKWLFHQFELHPNAVFSFICSLDEIDNNHKDMTPAQYRWELFDALYERFLRNNRSADVLKQDVIFGPEGYVSYTRTFYREKHASIIHIISSYLRDKYN